MSNRSWLYSALVAGAILGPPQLAQKSRGPASDATATPQWWDRMWSVEESSQTGRGSDWNRSELQRSVPNTASPGTEPLAPKGQARIASAPPYEPAVPISEILRFDVTPEWVMVRWPQVWTRHPTDELAGMRVTLVSGTRITDLAGALTYYFDREHLVQAIEFQGTCGDPSELIAIVSQQFGLQPIPSIGGYHYVLYTKDRKLESALRIENGRVVRHSQPHERFNVILVLHRPGTNRELSDQVQTRLGLPDSSARKSDASSSTSSPAKSDKAAGAKPQTNEKPRPIASGDADQRVPARGKHQRAIDALLPHAG